MLVIFALVAAIALSVPASLALLRQPLKVDGAHRPEPWREGRYGEQAVLWPVGALELLADPMRLIELRQRGTGKLALVRASMQTEGVREPLTVAIDHFGQMRLADGHHRLLVALDLGEPTLPVRFTPSDGIRRAGRQAIDVLPSIFLLTGQR